jgi:hypothetical protein
VNVQQFLIQSANQRPATDERRAEAYSLLFGKANDFDPERKSSSLQSFEQRNGKYDSEDAVISPRIRNCIEMGSYQEARTVGLRGRIKPAKISDGVDTHVNTQQLHPSSNFTVAIMHRRRQEGSARAAWVFRERC